LSLFAPPVQLILSAEVAYQYHAIGKQMIERLLIWRA